MNRPDQRFQDLFHGDPYYEQDYHQDYREPYWESFTQPGFIITLLLGVVGVVYHIFRLLDYDLLPLPELMWNVLVYLTPCRLLEFVETHTDPLRNPGIGKRRWNHSAKSQAMRQIIGLDAPGGIISTVAQAGRRRLSSISGISMVAQAGEGQPAGLGNWDNSCYQNSVLQGLGTLDPLTEYLTRPQIDEKLSDEETKPDMEMAEALRELIETLKDPSNNGRRVWTPAALKNMSSWQQQDAQEYFSKVLDEIDKEVAKAAKSIKKYPGLESQQNSTLSLSNPPPMSTFRNPLEGLIAQRVGCTKCGYSEGLSMIPFNCLTVPLGKAWEHDISECLDEYTKLEPIEGVECGKCTLLKHQRLLSTILERVKDSPEDNPVRVQTTERLEAVNLALEEDDYEDKTLLQKCKISAKNRVSTTKSRQAVVARPPKSLVVHFNRSLFDEMTGELRKNHSQVRFPKVLDLGPWCLGSSGKSSTAAMEEWLLNPEQSMIASTEKSSRLHGPLYELRAVVTHYGRHENGHYICYKKHPNTAVDEKGSVDEDWWRLSDDEVSKVSEENVLSQGGVFMLFFDCVEPAITVLQTAEQPQPTIVPELMTHVETVQAVEVSSPEPAYNNEEANCPGAPSDSLKMLPLTTMTRMHTDEESIAASVSDDEDPSEKEQEQQDYEPTKAIVLPKYVPTPGVENEEPGQKEIRPPVRFVMV